MGRRHTVETLLAPERRPSAYHTLGSDLHEEMKSRKKAWLVFQVFKNLASFSLNPYTSSCIIVPLYPDSTSMDNTILGSKTYGKNLGPYGTWIDSFLLSSLPVWHLLTWHGYIIPHYMASRDEVLGRQMLTFVCTILFYMRNLSICGFGILETILQGHRGTKFVRLGPRNAGKGGQTLSGSLQRHISYSSWFPSYRTEWLCLPMQKVHSFSPRRLEPKNRQLWESWKASKQGIIGRQTLQGSSPASDCGESLSRRSHLK